MSNELYHYGVKGMRWGVRKDKVKNVGKTAAKLASPTGYAAYKGVKAYKNYETNRYNRSDYAIAKTMSDQELRSRINRINLEQSYIQAIQRDRESYKEATESILEKSGRKTVRYISGLPNNKEFKKSAAKKLAKGILK